MQTRLDIDFFPFFPPAAHTHVYRHALKDKQGKKLFFHSEEEN